MTVRMRPIYYNSSLFYLILLCNKLGLYFTDQLYKSPGNNQKMGPLAPKVRRFSTPFKRTLAAIQAHRRIKRVAAHLLGK